ncbi:Fungal Zn(2)-Cys(6) binuclear cluster domain [Rhizoctonia solani]|uniref:Fungal Zn(2)-Cys(6) binuclear cluster domain n=1 Tax=Rhizoctonia solani TaxID=456999 RepID=A0A8H8SXA5_9AGAM|nr:Fungal Zn(2)-Cys(6) binuclear cluster domain [Rhizoctonia solani]QRW20083.1 Fungal Zn(2)-Cys(6) binuclear cluster domain [Rhizoctonia solani]
MHFATNVSRVLAQSPGTRSSMLQGWIGWIHEFERSVTTGFRNNMSPNDIGDCLKAHLELLALKASLMNGIFGYLVLRDALPKFLSLVATDSNLLIEQHNGGMVISFHRIINTHRYELTKFAVHDVLTVLLLGVPLLVEYGYDGDHEPENPMFEWIHGIPATFLEVMAQINSRRTGSRVRLDDWQTLEERVLFWKSRYAMLNDAPVPGSDDAERVAVQEGWRHLLLIYIYMV